MAKRVVAIDAVFDSFDWIGENHILVQLTAGDEHHAFVVSTSNIVDTIKLAMAFINSNLSAVLRETGPG